MKADCRLLYILALEGLILDRERYEIRFGEEEAVRHARLANLLQTPEYEGRLATMSVYSMFCLDKLEGAFEGADMLEARHWCDVNDVEALMVRLKAAIYICSVSENTPNRYFTCGSWRDASASDSEMFECDFFVMHWDEETFAHYDAVYCLQSGDKKVAPPAVQQVLRGLLQDSELCQAFMVADRSKARAIALRMLGVPDAAPPLPPAAPILITDEMNRGARSAASGVVPAKQDGRAVQCCALACFLAGWLAAACFLACLLCCVLLCCADLCGATLCSALLFLRLCSGCIWRRDERPE